MHTHTQNVCACMIYFRIYLAHFLLFDVHFLTLPNPKIVWQMTLDMKVILWVRCTGWGDCYTFYSAINTRFIYTKFVGTVQANNKKELKCLGKGIFLLVVWLKGKLRFLTLRYLLLNLGWALYNERYVIKLVCKYFLKLVLG